MQLSHSDLPGRDNQPVCYRYLLRLVAGKNVLELADRRVDFFKGNFTLRQTPARIAAVLVPCRQRGLFRGGVEVEAENERAPGHDVIAPRELDAGQRLQQRGLR